MRTEQLTRIFLAKLAGTPVFDPNADRVGRVRDAVASMRQDGSAPRILGFIVEVPQRRKIFIPITRVTSIDDGGVFITGALNIRRYQQRHGEIQLLAELLDHTTRLHENGDSVIIEDIGMELSETKDWFARQLHVLKKARGFRRGTSVTVNWSDVEVETPIHGINFNAVEEDINLLPAQDVAAAMHDLDMNRQTEIARTLEKSESCQSR